MCHAKSFTSLKIRLSSPPPLPAIKRRKVGEWILTDVAVVKILKEKKITLKKKNFRTNLLIQAVQNSLMSNLPLKVTCTGLARLLANSWAN